MNTDTQSMDITENEIYTDSSINVESHNQKTSKRAKKSAQTVESSDRVDLKSTIESLVDKMVHEPSVIPETQSIAQNKPVVYKKITPKILGGQRMSTLAKKRHFRSKPLHANIPNRTYNVI